jgi:hypothetical protein
MQADVSRPLRLIDRSDRNLGVKAVVDQPPLAALCPAEWRFRRGLGVPLGRPARNHRLPTQHVARAAPASRQVPIGAQLGAQGSVPRRRLRWLLAGRHPHTLAVGIDQRGDDVRFVYGQFGFLPGPPHQKKLPQEPPPPKWLSTS